MLSPLRLAGEVAVSATGEGSACQTNSDNSGESIHTSGLRNALPLAETAYLLDEEQNDRLYGEALSEL